MTDLTATAGKYVAKEHAGHHGDKLTSHSYIPVYERLLKKHRNGTLLEVGVAAGLSLKMWREWMPNAKIVGVDCSSRWISNEIHENFDIVIGSSNVPSVAEKLATIASKYDVIIDDGSHDPSIQIGTLHNLWHMLATGGTYIIEDIANIDAWEHEFVKLGERYSADTQVIDLRHIKNRGDDVLVVYSKR